MRSLILLFLVLLGVLFDSPVIVANMCWTPRCACPHAVPPRDPVPAGYPYGCDWTGCPYLAPFAYPYRESIYPFAFGYYYP